MPKRKLPSSEVNGVAGKRGAGAKRPRNVSNGPKLPGTLPKGEVLTDIKDCKWKLGPAIGSGGFGEIYLASDNLRRKPGNDAQYVVKIEPHTNGPLFSEMHFYFRVGKAQSIESWMKKKNISFLGMPKFMGSGSHEYNSVKYRFMVLERFGEDLQKLLEKNNGVFPIKTIYTLGVKILNILEYIHSHGYIHADVKAANLTSGFGESKSDEVHLIDFGLACKYTAQGVHKEFREDLRKAHDGTIEYTSRDAHIGAHSRRGDLEVLGYNMLQWICGTLPWEDNLKDPEYVCSKKKSFMKNIPSLMKACFHNRKAPQGIAEYLTYIASLEFDEEPKYSFCCSILKSGIKALGSAYDGKLVYKSGKSSSSKKLGHRTVPLQQDANKESRLPRLASESANVISTPCKKIRRVASATPRLQSIKSSNPSITEYISTIDNPTPAMLLVMQRKLEQLQEDAMLSKVVANGVSKGDHSEKALKSKCASGTSDLTHSAANGHDLCASNNKPRRTKTTNVRKTKQFQENGVCVKKKLFKKVENNRKKEIVTSPIAKRTRLLQKTRNKGTICGLRDVNFTVSSW